MTKPSRIKLWDKNFHILYDSETDTRTVEQFLADEAWDEVHYSKDTHEGTWPTRDSGRLIRSHDGERVIWSSSEWLNKMVLAATDAVFDDPGRFGADIQIREGSRVGVEMNGKVIIGTVKRAYEAEHGWTHIEMAEHTGLLCCGGGPQWGHAWDCKECPD